MNYKNSPISCYPAYTWLWNGTITRENIRKQIDEMYASGIRAFYIIGEPEYFRPTTRKTHLSPDYLSEEYLDLLYYAYETAKKKGMYTWLYNEGGFPSGMACGKIREKYPELAMKEWESKDFPLPPHEPYIPHERALSAFIPGGRKVEKGETFDEETVIREYRWKDCDDAHARIRSDIAVRKNCDIFLEMTHEKLKQRFGDAMGSDITLMFDDEAFMGQWTENFEKLFFDQYGYDIREYIPQIISNRFPPLTEKACRAKSDYMMLCGDLVRENYFRPMKEWLHDHDMLSTGHLDNDNKSDGAMRNRYGNALQTLREFDVPGIDVIWSQIDYPKEGKCCKEGFEFFPRIASSAARQQGHSRCMSESFAVYGAHVDPECMRYNVNFQAVQGISLFNFMVISYDRKTPMAHQYRPNFILENPGMDRQHEINDYSARLSHLLQESTAVIDTALYFPFRSICAHGELGKRAMESFEKLGDMLTKAGVSFDLIDEELVQNGKIENGALICEHVTYRNIFVPEGDFEPRDVLDKMSCAGKEIIPCILRSNPMLLARKMLFPDGSEGYFICNTAGETVSDEIILPNNTLCISEIDLKDGALYTPEYERKEDGIHLSLSLLRGEGIFLWCTSDNQNAPKRPTTKTEAALEAFSAKVERIYRLDAEKGILNLPGDHMLPPSGLGDWDDALSGEVSYTCRLPQVPEGEYILSLGKVHCTAKVYLNGVDLGESTMPPYRILLGAVKGGEVLKIVVANTAANECARTDYFARHPKEDVGMYHQNMVPEEEKAPAGGLFGPVTLDRIL